MSETFKGFDRGALEFDVRGSVLEHEGVIGPLPHHRLRPLSGEALFARGQGLPRRDLGDPKEQIPYGTESLALGGEAAYITEGESCTWAILIPAMEMKDWRFNEDSRVEALCQ